MGISRSKPSLEESARWDSFDAFRKKFQEHLRNLGDQDVWELMAEVPSEHQSEWAPQLIRDYLDQGFTVRGEDLVKYPQYAQYVDDAVQAAKDSSTETIATGEIETRAIYEVEKQVWKGGGQGRIHKARDQKIAGRQVVLKVSRDSSQREAFDREVIVTAQLEHPGVAAVFTQGLEGGDSGSPFFAMRLIHGDPLEDRIAAFHNRIRGLKERERRRAFWPLQREGIARLLEKIISASHTVAHAHSVGVLHCDLKPKNIVCGHHQATIVLDWGSAQPYQLKPEEVSDSSPRVEIPGESSSSHTPQYSSPEQFRGEQKTLMPTSDVFSLGATLYQALTGETPFRGGRTPHDTFRRPRDLDRVIPRRLEAICCKAMEMEPSRRYQSADAFAQDLADWMRGNEIQAYRDSLLDKASRFARQYSLATAIAIPMLILLSVLGTLLTVSSIQKRAAVESLGAAIKLVDKLIKPLENDEIAELEEAAEIDNFTTYYINENPRGNHVGWALTTRSLLQHQAFNRGRKVAREEASQRGEPAMSPTDMLVHAIDSLQQAEAFFLQDGHPLELYRTRIRLARWNTELAELSDPGELDGPYFKRREEAYRLVQGVIDSAATNPADPHSGRIVEALAEAYQLHGELTFTNYQRLRIEGEAATCGPDDLSDEDRLKTLAKSAASFTQAIRLLTDRMDQQIEGIERGRQIQRRIARAYGWRGDAIRVAFYYDGDASRLSSAARDYHESLRIRRTLHEESPSPESRFQLARGLANFALLVRSAPWNAALDGIDQAAASAAKPREVFVVDSYLREAMELVQDENDHRNQTDLNLRRIAAADLYLFAAYQEKRETEESKQAFQEYLAEAECYAADVIESLGTDEPQSIEELQVMRFDHRLSLASAKLVELQAQRLRGEDATAAASYVRIVIDPGPKHLTYKDLTSDPELFLDTCAIVALPSQFEAEEQLDYAIVEQGLASDPRYRKHFELLGVGENLGSAE